MTNRQSVIVECSGRKVVLYPIAKTGQFRIINSIAHIIDEFNDEGFDVVNLFTELAEREKRGEKVDFDIRTIYKFLVLVADRIEGDLDRIVDASTNDVSLKELQAGRMDVGEDFDPDLYWELIGEIIVLNKDEYPKWFRQAVSLQKKVSLAFGEKEKEKTEETAAGQPEEEQVKAGTSETGGTEEKTTTSST